MAEHELKRIPPGPFDRVRLAENLAALGLLLVLLSTAVAGITIALIGQDWSTLWRTLFFGLLLGWSLAIFRKSIWVTAFVVFAIGVLYILLFPGGMLGKVLGALSEFNRLYPDLWNSFRSGDVDLAPLAPLSQDLLASTWTIIARVQAWSAALLTDQPNFDPIPASLAWGALIWLIAAWAGWVLAARRDALLAAFPAILLSLGTLAYGRREPFIIYLMLGTLLLLLAVVQQGHRRQFWDQASIAYPLRKGRQITIAASFITVGLVIFAAFTSSLSIQRIQEWIDEHWRSSRQQSSELAKSLGIAPGGTPAPDAFTTVRSPGLPRDHLIGSGPELSERVVMTIRVENLTSLPPSGGRQPFYWRAFTYDRYIGDGWRSGSTEQSTYEANQPLEAARTSGHILIRQQIYPVENLGGTLYAAGEPLTVDLQSQAAWRSNGDLFGVQLERAAAYGADSQLPLVDERALRLAGQRYPDWVRARYLALPADVPDRVRALAIELTAAERTPYDRARAIEDYLRSFPYTLEVARPPVGRDVVDYFLFDLKKGYCDYYASSMVVLARAAGIPARLVVGYANGTYNLNSKRFVVTEADAHSWAEIYFPRVGWVTFEPTPGRPPLRREEVSAPAQSSDSPPVPSQEATGPQGWRFVPGPLILAGLAVIAWIMIEELRLNHLPEQAVAVAVYRRLRRYGRYMDVVSGPEDTPYEFSASLRHRLQGLSLPSHEPDFMPRLIDDLQSISDGIVQALYRPSGAARDRSVLSSWRRLRGRLWSVRLLEQWRSWTGNLKEKWGVGKRMG